MPSPDSRACRLVADIGGTNSRLALFDKQSCELRALRTYLNRDYAHIQDIIAAWLNGYFHGKRADTKVDTQKLNADADKVEKFCFQNPQAPLMQSVESIVGSAN